MDVKKFIPAIATGLALFIGIVSVHFYGNDNAIEELADEVIKHETGIDILASIEHVDPKSVNLSPAAR
jgi:zinc transporter ZupT